MVHQHYVKSGFGCISMSEDAKKKSTFTTHMGVYFWNVIPFRLQGSLARYMRVMDKVLKVLQKFAHAYIDDILIHT